MLFTYKDCEYSQPIFSCLIPLILLCCPRFELNCKLLKISFPECKWIFQFLIPYFSRKSNRPAEQKSIMVCWKHVPNNNRENYYPWEHEMSFYNQNNWTISSSQASINTVYIAETRFTDVAINFVPHQIIGQLSHMKLLWAIEPTELNKNNNKSFISPTHICPFTGLVYYCKHLSQLQM